VDVGQYINSYLIVGRQAFAANTMLLKVGMGMPSYRLPAKKG